MITCRYQSNWEGKGRKRVRVDGRENKEGNGAKRSRNEKI